MILDYPQIGKNLAKRRKELKLKQYEVCERAEINDKYLSCIETARSIPSLEVFLRLCTALETTPDRILFGTVRQTDYTKDSTILLEKFQRLSPNNKRLCLAFMDLLSEYVVHAFIIVKEPDRRLSVQKQFTARRKKQPLCIPQNGCFLFKGYLFCF